MSRTAYPLGRALEFLERVWRVNHAMQRVSTRMQHELGVTGPQRLVIRCVGQFPGVTSSQLAEMLHLDRGSVSAALNRLEAMRMVERRTDPDDGRRVTLGLTASGRKVDRPTKHTIEATVEQVISATSASDLEATRRVLAALASALEGEADRD
jgi:DNA-binding MarR family transcriptional regulator